MLSIAAVVLPVFLVIGAGYAVAWRRILDPGQIDGLMSFAQWIAVPILLFRAVATIDLAHGFDPRLLAAFYGGATSGFLTGMLGARFIFARNWEDAVAIGFVGLFSNSLLLGMSITERAYGADALAPNVAIIAVHSPFCYALGITAMEIAKARGGGAGMRGLLPKIGRAMFSNTLILGISAGLVLNVSGLTLPEPVTAGLDLIARAGIPVALFALGGVLIRYRPEGDMRTILYIVLVSLVLHPAVTFGLGHLLGLGTGGLRSAVVTASVAPGINAWLFANMYGRAKRVAASAVLIGTGATILSAAFWLSVLP